ncbi:ATP-binding cassette domain-containing protein [uncultured Microbacterium sp.]|uniref:ATP-binding cassette domain-containing protein n=1 Tax=uncultured Microbacterium sp. TaxID=191216 RepID=UPI00262C5225|nr:ATP-binding cassette domain-containing protein [uncultured Microbacterium sp.]
MSLTDARLDAGEPGSVIADPAPEAGEAPAVDEARDPVEPVSSDGAAEPDVAEPEVAAPGVAAPDITASDAAATDTASPDVPDAVGSDVSGSEPAAVAPDATAAALGEVDTDPRPDAPAGATGANPASADPTPADPTPADVAVEEPVVEEPVPGEPAVEEPADPTPVDVAVEEPADPTPVDVAVEEPADPTPADVAIEEPVVEKSLVEDPAVAGETRAAPASETAADEGRSDGGSSDSEELDGAGPITEGERDAVSADAPENLLHAPQVPVGEAADGEDPTPPEVRVDELIVDDTPVASPDAPAVEEPLSNEPGADEPGADEPGADEPAASDTALPGEVAPLSDTAVLTHGAAAAVDPDAVPVLSLRNVTKSFGELRAVDAIDLTVPAGSFYGLVGPNGAGKTTTLSIIAGLLRADSGSVSINGVDATKRSREAKKLIGVLPDRLRTFDRLTGRQLLSYYGALRGLPAPLVESRTADLARAFDLVDALARPVSDYSAGMTKKVMLAGAMIHSPRLLVLDEPFEAVDPVSSGVILDILGSYVDHGGTVILSSHGMELVERVCSRVAVIVAGQVLAEGTVDEVRGEASLEERYLELAGGLGDVEGLEWLHTFSA